MTLRDGSGAGRLWRRHAAAPGLSLVLVFATPALGAAELFALDRAALARPEPRAQSAEAQAAQATDAQAGQGRLSSVLFHELPAGFPLEVISFDDTDLDLEIRGRFEEELQKAGHLVADDAPLELSFTTEVVQGELAKRQPSLGRLGASTEQDVGDRGSRAGVDMELNVWSSSQDSVLGGRRSRASGSGTRYHMTVQLRDRDSGRVLWQGEAFCDMLAGDRAQLARSMVRPLVGAYGRSVKDEPFAIE